MYFILAWLLHFIGVHTKRPYGSDFKDEWNEGVKDGEYRCIICRKILKEEV